MKKRDKKKPKGKSSGKMLSKEKEKRSKKSKKGKEKPSVKVLGKTIKRLTRELQARNDELYLLKTCQDAEERSNAGSADLMGSLTDWVGPGSVSDRKRTWERHQFLRSRYEHHLAAGRDKPRARILADEDLRKRYGDEVGYTEDQLEGILS